MCLYVRVAVFGLLSTSTLTYKIKIFIILIVLIVLHLDRRVCRHCAATSSGSNHKLRVCSRP